VQPRLDDRRAVERGEPLLVGRPRVGCGQARPRRRVGQLEFVHRAHELLVVGVRDDARHAVAARRQGEDLDVVGAEDDVVAPRADRHRDGVEERVGRVLGGGHAVHAADVA
jgi:hypothetical protein